jgi:enolase
MTIAVASLDAVEIREPRACPTLPVATTLDGGTGRDRIKAAAPARGERVARYNRLTEIDAGGTLPRGF